MSITIVIVEKPGTIKLLTIKDFVEEELFKKCGFKKNDGFAKQTEWSVKTGGKKYTVGVFAKTDGRANCENKYDFPPPIDKKLFFGSCAVVAYLKNADGSVKYVDLTLSLWEKLYEKLFGGFEDLKVCTLEDEYEEDELDEIPASKKTKQGGYLKDGFVVDSDSDDKEEDFISEDDEDEDEEGEETNTAITEDKEEEESDDLGSELSEEDYSDDEEDK
jgi:hypothetical protein